jgi:hypothetical protein
VSGEIDRRALGSIVFASSEKLEQLNAIVWPAVRIAVSARLAEMIVAVPADHCRVAVRALLGFTLRPVSHYDAFSRSRSLRRHY